jgi:hypothetical protein
MRVESVAVKFTILLIKENYIIALKDEDAVKNRECDNLWSRELVAGHDEWCPISERQDTNGD